MNNKEINGKPVAQLPCCGIFAAAVVMGQEPQKVFNAYKREYGKSNRWKGSTYRESMLKFLTKKKVRWSEVEHPKRITVKKFGERYAKPSGVYMIWVSGHVMTLCKGELIDQWHHQKLFEAKRNRSIVKKAILIENPAPLMEGLVCESGLQYEARVKASAEEKGKRREEKIKETVHSPRHRANLEQILKEKKASHKIDLNKVVRWRGREWKLVGYNKRWKRNPFVLMLMERGTTESQIFEPSYQYVGCAGWTAIQQLFSINLQVEEFAA